MGSWMKKRRSTEQIVGLLRQADLDPGKGMDVPDTCTARTHFQPWKCVPTLAPGSYSPPPSSTACRSATAAPPRSKRHRPAEEIAGDRGEVSF